MDAVHEWVVDQRCKSFPPVTQGVPASRIVEQRWQLGEDFMTPVALLADSALTHNLAWMREYCGEHAVQIAPHGKTTMSPELIARQLEYGAWGVTVATAWQARTVIGFGAQRVIVANECIDPVGLRVLAEYVRDHPDVEVYTFVDSLAAVDAMREVLRSVEGTRPFPALVEVGIAGRRAGARTAETAVQVGRAIADAPELELAGVGGFEGVLGTTRTPAVIEQVRTFLSTMRQAANELINDDAFRADHPVILTAGGSTYFDHVADVFTANRSAYASDVEVVIRPGCYLTHDHVNHQQASPFADDGTRELRPALQVWARVLSVPEPGLAIIDAGKRDISTDGPMPLVVGRYRAGRYVDAIDLPNLNDVVVDRFNDQHGYLHTSSVPADTLSVGDLVALGISHPCTTFDKWRAIPVVDDDYRVVSAVRTFF